MSDTDVAENLTVGQVIRAARHALELTQEQLASSMGVSGVTVSRWERDTQRPSLIECQKLAKKLSRRGHPLLAEDFRA
jgi:transcriptional regulator with XRE-family HTH domain